MAPPHLFTATSYSARQLLMLLRCISFAKTAQVRISAEGIRFSTEDSSFMEAFVFLDRSLFASYTYSPPPPPSSQDDPPDPPIFEVSLDALLETLNIFSLSDPNAARKPGDHDSFAAHRLTRHAGIDAFSNQTLGVSGVCTFTYEGEGQPLTIYMSETGVTTTGDLTTYEAESTEEIPFNRDAVAMKTIMRSTYLLDAIAELGSMSPETLTITASPSSHPAADLSLSASGALGSAAVEFQANGASDSPILETHQCGGKTAAKFKFALIKAAQRAMASATKVSVRLDGEGVLSLQFLVEVEGGGEGVVFVDFRVVPLVDGAEEASSPGED
ncbi:Rad1-domain-containing protein [Teratosphaeria nubilosa]|uniref:Rad1-domain-containing protein n=1 Tax=Teratosphaeria nubilosa TaxID=161662 RepID=A0A6G1KXX3_9PEZI|nr:Rad1-domain-containing protein [Teratosphaeria nubilosa]